MAKKVTKPLSVGTSVKITGNSSAHRFNNGDVLKVQDVFKNTIYVSNGTKSAWIYAADVATVNPVPHSVETLSTLVEKAANELIKATGSTSSLEVKEKLRKEYPRRKFYQNEISVALQDLATNGKFNYTFNGVYRTYTSNKVQRSAVTTPKVATTPKSGKVSRTKALELIENSNRIITVTFEKKDGTTRKVVGRYFKEQGRPLLGYVKLKDIQKAKNGTLSPVVNVNLQTLSELKVDGNTYKVN